MNFFKKIILILIFAFILGDKIHLYAQDEFFEPQTNIGGYGELHYNYSYKNTKPVSKLDFHRFVLFLAHTFSEKWTFKSEVELEHNLVGEDSGKLELEQAYIDYHFRDYLGFQAGVLLIPSGIVNEYHEPPTFFGVERPEYHKYLVPTTWFGNGIAIYGLYEGFDYKLSISEGLNSDKFNSSSGIRNGRQNGFEADARNLLYVFRINYISIPQLLVGSSISYNNATGDSTNIPFSLIEFHLKYVSGNLYLTGEFANISYWKPEKVNSFGFYADIGFNFRNLLNIDWDMITFLRYTNYNTAIVDIPGYDIKKWLAGVSIKPLNSIVLKADFGQRKTERNTIEKLFNLGIGYMF